VKLGSGVSGRRAAAGAPLKILRRRRRQKFNGAPPPPINKGRRAAAEQMASARTSNQCNSIQIFFAMTRLHSLPYRSMIKE
jgi:hypothetical protein